MDDIVTNADIRREQAYQRVDGRNLRCSVCPEDDPRCIELHHVAGQAYHDQTVPTCRNCHRKRSDEQRDHPAQIAFPPSYVETVAHFLLGAAEMLRALAQTLIEFAKNLIAQEQANAGAAK